MRVFLFALLLLTATTSQAGTRGQFLGMQLIVNIASVMYDGSNDSSPHVLFEAMNRPEQDSMVGRGKVLEAPQKVLNFICARKGENNYHCAIYIHQSPLARIGPGMAHFEARGAEARALFEQFHTQDNRFSFRDGDGLFLIEATPERFVMKFNSNGV
ncbi:hypothetical protein [Bdellovibrio bacteriovorus]|uniref:Uncharacterized protein n=1 Tax=Bdellovibrio bacteriovorus str. Tiberius TaxID=1069642 RepID=K7YP60_BDEBC|nr:hypothetical protein [Bdellovibrio bacteriovorus]AFY01616.1 hypothetical protein Bdt_1929 [Bdellovibrio bacteriovorus str. Tiberius]